MADVSPEELAQIQSGPNYFALRWVTWVAEDDAAQAWPAMTEDFRLAVAQNWIYHNPAGLRHPSAQGLDRNELAALLSAQHPQHELFTHVKRVAFRNVRESYGNLDHRQLGIAPRPRPLAPDLELVRLLYLPDLSNDGKGNYSFEPGAQSRGVSVVVDSTGPYWQIAGVSDQVMTPGWPPAAQTIVGPGD